MKKRSVITIALALVLSLTLLAGCGQSKTNEKSASLTPGGVLVLSVNPEIAVEYDKNGVVTGVTARNDDALAIINLCEGMTGQNTREVVTRLVTAIGEAGYFVEETEGGRRQITLEIEAGSKLPYDAFLEDVAADVRKCVSGNNWNTPLKVGNESDYGMASDAATSDVSINEGTTDYNGTDYGPNNDGVTDYNDTDYGPNNDGVTDYNDTDYGPNNDGVTDYNDTDYGPNNDGVTDYNDTDYGPNNDGVTDYNDTDYDDGSSNYDDDSHPGNSDYDD